jgi:hypothetical protein
MVNTRNPRGDLPSVVAARVANASLLAQVVVTQRLNTRPVNTSSAYDPKNREYMAFCDHVYSHSPIQSRYTIGTEKVFEFLFYHAFRNQYKRGGRGNGLEHGFVTSDYDLVTSKWGSYMSRFSTGEITDIPDPEKPVAADTLNTYKTVLFNQWLDQASAGANSLTWELIFTRKCRELVNLVKERKTRIKRKKFDEKVDGEFTPFTSIGQVTKIEQAFWDHGKTVRESVPSLRNRYVFLQCYSGLLRHESMFLGELSDMVGVEYKRKDHDPFFILVMQIATGKFVYCVIAIVLFLLTLTVDCCFRFPGKTVKSDKKKQFGRSMRHKDVTQCSVGAFGMYLLFRFHKSGEMDDDRRPNFGKNQEWYEIKILSDGTRSNTKKELQKRTYTEPLRKLLKRLLIYACHFGHWGRVSAPPEMEFKEIDPEFIRILGEMLIVVCLFVFVFIF